LKVQLSAEGMCTDADGEYEWIFGDDSPSIKGPTATHTYSKPGTYTAKVNIVDTTHHVDDTDEVPISVSQP
ncbi:MAG TPA: PKD domain-containing protein, partial [Candidatus Acidoferrales bacterium]|nr:PKD domain-containing protein [Candidatus Acidoferrales bacterium]